MYGSPLLGDQTLFLQIKPRCTLVFYYLTIQSHPGPAASTIHGHQPGASENYRISSPTLYWIQICMLTMAPDDLYAQWSLRSSASLYQGDRGFAVGMSLEGCGRQPSKMSPNDPRLLVFTPLWNLLSLNVNWTYELLLKIEYGKSDGTSLWDYVIKARYILLILSLSGSSHLLTLQVAMLWAACPTGSYEQALESGSFPSGA